MKRIAPLILLMGFLTGSCGEEEELGEWGGLQTMAEKSNVPTARTVHIRLEPGEEPLHLPLGFLDGSEEDLSESAREAAQGERLNWREVPGVLAAACEKAPMERVGPGSPGGGLQNYKIEEMKLPVRIVLRWNPTIKRCKVYVGQVLCNYDERGIERALQKVKQIKQTGVYPAEIDAGGDVPVRWVIEAFRMLVRADMEEINFTGRVNPLGGKASPKEVPKFIQQKKEGLFLPDVTVEVLFKRGTEFRYVQALMQLCARMGIYKIKVGDFPGEMLDFSLPTDMGMGENGPWSRDVFENEKKINTDEPPIEDPVLKDAEISKPGETDDNEDYESGKGVEDAVSKKPLRGTAIGIGRAGGTYGGRFGGRRNLREYGGGRHTESAVLMSLIWLKNHQNPDGMWSCRKFMMNCKKGTCTGGGGDDAYDMGCTSLAMLAFLGAGHTHKHGKFKNTVKKGLKAMKARQTPDGCVGPQVAHGHWIYNHAMATLALAEAYGLSNKSPLLQGPAQKAVDFLVECQNPYLGWRYGKRTGENDTSVTAWAVLALKSAKISGLHVPRESFDGALNWLDKVTDEVYCKSGYTSKGDTGSRLMEAMGKFQTSEAMTAAAVTSRIFILGPEA
ncbi:MAG: prenyltransferase/squalene oxidase repeat-containing protein, partial [Planctomycetota bacterium]